MTERQEELKVIMDELKELIALTENEELIKRLQELYDEYDDELYDLMYIEKNGMDAYNGVADRPFV